MSIKKQTQRGTAKDKVIAVANDLFYRQGYNATGIQQIIDEAEVSKGTFYTHFKSKEDLGVVYLRTRHQNEISYLKENLAKIKDPKKKYFQFNEMMREWMRSGNYRGCAFANMAAEVTDTKCQIRKEAKYHYEAFRAVIHDMVKDLFQSDKKYQHLDVGYVSDQYMIIQIGAMTNAEVYQDIWPYDHAAIAIKKLIEE